MDLHSPRASADASPDFLEEAWVLADTNPGPPEACIEDWTVLSGWCEKTQVNCIWHSTDFISVLVETTAEKDLLLAITVGVLASTNCLASRKKMCFSMQMRWISFFFCQTEQSSADEAWEPLQLKHSLGPSHQPSCLSFLHHWHFAATLQHQLMWPNLLQLKKCTGFGTNKATFTFR